MGDVIPFGRDPHRRKPGGVIAMLVVEYPDGSAYFEYMDGVDDQDAMQRAQFMWPNAEIHMLRSVPEGQRGATVGTCPRTNRGPDMRSHVRSLRP